MKIYNYNSETFEFISESKARRDPLEKEEKYLIPAHATTITPIFEKGKITKFDKNLKSWSLEEPFRKKEDKKKSEKEIFEELKNLLAINRKSFLFQSDWRVIAFVERNKEIPKDIADKRKLAIYQINTIKEAETLEELQNYNINFN